MQPARCANGDGFERPRVVGDVVAYDHANTERRVGLRVVERHVDAERRQARRAGEVDVDRVFGHRQGTSDVHGSVVAVDVHRVAVDAVRQRTDLLRHPTARGLDDPPPYPVDAREIELPHHGQQLLAAAAVAGGERVEIALGHDGVADVVGDDAHQRLVANAAVEELHDRDAQPLLVEVASVGSEAAATDVGDVAGRGEEPHGIVAVEHRRHGGEVVEVPGAVPGVVRDEHVARDQACERVHVEELADGSRHGVHMARCSRDGLRQHLPVGIEYPGREIARFPHHGREGRAHQRLRLLFDDGEQAVPDELVADVAHGVLLSQMLPESSTLAAKPSGTMVDV